MIHNETATDAAERNLCHDEHQMKNEPNSESHTSLAYYRFWFIFGQILHGIGAAPILTLGDYSIFVKVYFNFKTFHTLTNLLFF